MTNFKTTKRALVSSVLALVMCFSMLLGTTFAWFTDSVTSSGNIIQTGNLKIELEYYNGTEWKSVQGASDILKDGLWEPGYTDVAYLRMKNVGSLDLKYQLGVEITETEGVNRAGETFKLSDYIYFDVIEGVDGQTSAYATRDAALAAVTDAELISAGYAKADKLEAGSDYLYLAMVVYMPTSVGNEASHNGTDIPEINMTVSVLATQLNSEEDSFGPDYDSDAWVDGWKVYTADDLQAAINNGKDVVLMNDIVLTEAIVIPAPAAATYSRTVDYTVIDLNGKALTIEAAYDDSNYLASSAVVNNGNVILTGEGTIKATNNYTVRNYGTMVIDGVTVENGIMNFADLTVESGNISNSRSGKHTIYGNNATLTINGGTFYNGNPGNAAIFAYAGEVTINGGEFSIADGTSTLGWTSCLIDAQGSAVYTINGGMINGEIRDYNKNTVVNGGTFSVKPNDEFIAEGYVAVKSNGTYTVLKGDTAVTTTEELVAAINAGKTAIALAPGNYALEFTQDATFNMDNLTIVGADGVNLAVSSTEVWYGQVRGDNVVFENINFTTDTVGATGKATYRNCTFAGTLEFASSNNAETYVYDCVIAGNVHTSGDMSAGNAYITGSTVAKAEYASKATVTFENCEIGDITIWGGDTVINGCDYASIENKGTGSVTVDGLRYVSTADELAAAVSGGATEIMLANGEYDMPHLGTKANGVTFIGESRDGVVIKLYNQNTSSGDFCLECATATLENMTFVTEIKDWAGFQNAENLTFNGCKFINNLFTTGNATFNDCEFVVTTNHYNVWAFTDLNGGMTYMPYTLEFNRCVFNSTGKSIYVDGNNGKLITVKFNGCTFNDDDTCATDKAAIETGSTYGRNYDISITGCTFNGFAVNPNGINTNSVIWANKASLTTDQLNVVIDGVDVY